MATFTVTEQAATGAGSLAAAIAAAEASAGPDRIVFAASVTRIATSATLTINSNIVIDGDRNNDGVADVTVSSDFDTDGIGNHTLFVLGTGAKVTFDGLIFTKGMGIGTTTEGVAGAILNNGTVTIKNSQFLENQAIGLVGQAGADGTSNNLTGAAGADGGGAAGAILNRGTMSIQDTVFLENSGIGGNGGRGGNGGTSIIYYNGVPISYNGGSGGDGADGGYGAGAIVNFTGGSLTLSAGVVLKDNIGVAGNGGNGGDASQYALDPDASAAGDAAHGSASILDFGAVSGTATVKGGSFSGGIGGEPRGGDGVGSIQPTKIGTDGADVRTGLRFSETFAGMAGEDTFFASRGNDLFDGGAGSDTINFSASRQGVTFNLSLATAQSIGFGNLTVVAVENVIGGSGKDRITGSVAANRLEGRAGDDVLISIGSGATLVGGAGDDTYHVTLGSQVIETEGYGKDRLIFNGSGSFLLAPGVSVENMVVGEQAGASNLTGNNFAQTLRGNADNNILDGSGGSDRMMGRKGDDLYIVDNARDQVFEAAMGGSDTVTTSVSFALGAAQEIELLQTANREATAQIRLTGSNTAQTILGNNGVNHIRGEGGNDYIRAWDGDDTVYGGVGNDTLEGWSGNDKLFGQAGNDVFYGNTGNDIIRGGNGNDVIYAAEDDDVIYGEAGNDSLYGGSGNDAFVFDTTLSKANTDTIMDFANGAGNDDIILLDDAIFKALAGGALKESNFWLGADAHDANDRIIYDRETGILAYDADGDGSRAARQIALLSNNVALTAADFLVT